MTMKNTIVSSSLLALAVIAACERPPVDGVTPPDPNSTDSAVDIAAFVADTPVIGADWYAYDFTTHVLTPTDQSYVVRIVTSEAGDDDVVRYAAFRPTSYYDEQTGDSGIFTLQLTQYVDGAWSTATSLRLTQNVKTADVCLNLLEGTEVACDDAHLRVETNPRLIPEAGLVVAEPSFSLPSLAGVAELDLVDGTIVAAALNALPDPATLSYAPHVAADKLALGCNVVDDGRTHFIVLGRDKLAKVSFTSTTVRYALADLDLTGPTATAFGAAVDLAVEQPTSDDARLFALTADEAVTTTPTPTLIDPPAALTWSFALYRTDADDVCVLLSPAGAAASVDAAFDDAVVPAP